VERPQDDLCGFAVGARIGAAFLPSKDPVATLLATFTELALGLDRTGPCSGVGEAREETSSPGASVPWGGALAPSSSAPWAGVMGAARASTAGHWGLAFNDLSEAQTACIMGRGMMGFAFPTASLGTIPFPSLFLTSFTSHHTAFTTPSGVIFHSMFNAAAASLSTTWPRGQCKACQ
jgi:hypothetical protein